MVAATSRAGARDDSIGQSPPRHGHQCAGDLLRAELGQEIACAGSPRHLATDACDHAVEQLVDDLVEWQVDISVSRM
jgi:hypothetical protein